MLSIGDPPESGDFSWERTDIPEPEVKQIRIDHPIQPAKQCS